MVLHPAPRARRPGHAPVTAPANDTPSFPQPLGQPQGPSSPWRGPHRTRGPMSWRTRGPVILAGLGGALLAPWASPLPPDSGGARGRPVAPPVPAPAPRARAARRRAPRATLRPSSSRPGGTRSLGSSSGCAVHPTPTRARSYPQPGPPRQAQAEPWGPPAGEQHAATPPCYRCDPPPPPRPPAPPRSRGGEGPEPCPSTSPASPTLRASYTAPCARPPWSFGGTESTMGCSGDAPIGHCAPAPAGHGTRGTWTTEAAAKARSPEPSHAPATPSPPTYSSPYPSAPPPPLGATAARPPEPLRQRRAPRMGT